MKACQDYETLHSDCPCPLIIKSLIVPGFKCMSKESGLLVWSVCSKAKGFLIYLLHITNKVQYGLLSDPTITKMNAV